MGAGELEELDVWKCWDSFFLRFCSRVVYSFAGLVCCSSFRYVRVYELLVSCLLGGSWMFPFCGWRVDLYRNTDLVEIQNNAVARLTVAC